MYNDNLGVCEFIEINAVIAENCKKIDSALFANFCDLILYNSRCLLFGSWSMVLLTQLRLYYRAFIYQAVLEMCQKAWKCLESLDWPIEWSLEKFDFYLLWCSPFFLSRCRHNSLIHVSLSHSHTMFYHAKHETQFSAMYIMFCSFSSHRRLNLFICSCTSQSIWQSRLE